jgi:stearoyl-CoA desaturase (delta-9 desaturase)
MIHSHSFAWWLALVAYVLVTTNMASLAVSIYLHRELTHGSVTLSRPCRWFCRFIIWFITGMEPVEWRLVHLAHHRAPSDGPDDPHSPHNEGMWRIIAFGVWYYRRAIKEMSQEVAAEKKISGDFLGRQPLRHIGVLANLALNILLWGTYPGIAVWLIQIVWIPFWAAGVVNGLGHGAEERDHHTRDLSKDLLHDGPPVLRGLLNFITAGESNHHVHHLRQGSARFTMKRDEFDWGFTVVRMLAFLHLAKVRHIQEA